MYDNDNMHQKIKIMAEIWNPGSLKHFITPTPYWKVIKTFCNQLFAMLNDANFNAIDD